MTRLYLTALRLLPGDVRRRHGDQMQRVFAALLRDARARAATPNASSA